MRSRTSILLVLAIVWLVALSISYSVMHTETFRLAGGILLNLGLPLVAAGAVVLAGSGVGTLMLRDLDGFSALERASLRAMLGLGALGLLILLAGLLCLLPPTWLAWVVTAGIVAALHRPIGQWLVDVRDGLRDAFAPGMSRAVKWVRWIVLAALVAALLLGLTPVTANDSLIYHMSGPIRFSAARCVTAVRENSNLAVPLMAEMLYTWMVSLGAVHGAALIHGFYGWLVLAMVLGLTKRQEMAEAGWWAVAVLLVSRSLWEMFSIEYSDLLMVSYSFGALLLILSWGQSRADSGYRRLMWAGVLTGMMLGSKVTGPAYAVGLGVLTLWLSRHNLRQMITAGAVLAGCALLVYAPWMVRDGLQYQNPFAPFVGGLPGVDPLNRYYYLHRKPIVPLMGILFAPLWATVMGAPELAPFGSDLGALWLGLIPLGLVTWQQHSGPHRRLIKAFAVFCVPLVIIWLVGMSRSGVLVESRYLYVLFPPLAVFGGLGIQGLQRGSGHRFMWLVQGITLVFLATATVADIGQVARNDTLGVITGLRSQDSYLRDVLGPYYDAMEEINSLPDTPKVLMLWEWRDYYCVGRCVPDYSFSTWWVARQRWGSAADIARAWRAEGITHVLILHIAPERLLERGLDTILTQADLDALDVFIRQQLTEVWQDPGGFYVLYRLNNATQ